MRTLYSLVVLKDFGLDPASKQARRMMQRVEKLVFKPLNNRPFLDGETEPCINGRILAIGAYFVYMVYFAIETMNYFALPFLLLLKQFLLPA